MRTLATLIFTQNRVLQKRNLIKCGKHTFNFMHQIGWLSEILGCPFVHIFSPRGCRIRTHDLPALRSCSKYDYLPISTYLPTCITPLPSSSFLLVGTCHCHNSASQNVYQTFNIRLIDDKARS